MLKMGFATGWVEIVSRCMALVKFSFNVNGVKCGECNPDQRAEAGDPLSSYFFLLCAGGLLCLLHDAERSKVISCLKLSRQGPLVSHLFFADENLLFFKEKMREAHVIQDTLCCYERVSGQTVNFDKSIISFNPRIEVSV